jgi:hypothetical protein
VTAQVTIGTDSIRATGSFKAKQTDFGIKPFKGGPGGTVKVADEVTLCFDLLGTRDLAEAPGGRPQDKTGDPTRVPGCEDTSNPNEPQRRPM